MLRVLSVVALAAAVGCTSGGSGLPTPADPPAAAPPWFEDVTAASGVAFTYRNGEEANHFAIIESLGGGVAAFDFDGDGLVDLFFPGGGRYEGKAVLGNPCKLFKNLGGFKFKDVTDEVGLAGPWQYAHGGAAFDYDCDGWTDLLVTGYNRLRLFHNEPDGKGGRKFVDVTAKAGLKDNLWSTSAAWADLDGDGFPEIYVAHYGDWGFDANHPTDCNYDGKTRDVCAPKKFRALPHTLYRNNRDGTFADVSREVNLRTDTGKGIGVLAADLNADGRPDIYTSNDTDPNFLYVNRTPKGGPLQLEERGGPAMVALDAGGGPNGSMGLDAADYDRSGRPSLLVTNYENELPALYQNRTKPGGPEVFFFATGASGLGAVGGNYVSWGTGFADFDRDGWEDLVTVSGHAIRYPSAKYGRQQRPYLLRNDGGRFQVATDRAGGYFQATHNARGLAFVDLDNDGGMDLVVSHLNEPVVILRNAVPAAGGWVGFGLKGAKDRCVVGARVVVEAGGVKLTRFAKGGGSYGTTHDRRLLFGLGAADKIDKVTVYWPWGEAQEYSGAAAGRYWALAEGATAAR